jgi:hypothetical protein
MLSYVGMTVSQAVRALRKHVGKTQQVWATELGMSIRALFTYEHGKIPEPKQLVAFASAASAAGRDDLWRLFMKATAEQLGAIDMIWTEAEKIRQEMEGESRLPPPDWYEKQTLKVVRACLRERSGYGEGKLGYGDFAWVVMGAVTSAVEKFESDPEIRRRFIEESVRRRYFDPPKEKRRKK